MIYLSRPNKGMSVIETLIYAALLVLITAVLIGAFLPLSRILRDLQASRNIQKSARISLERMTRDIHSASNIGGGSILNAHPGKLFLIVPQGGVETEVEFYLQNETLVAESGGEIEGNLTSSDVSVSNLVFQVMDNGKSKLVRIEMTLERNVSGKTKTADFYGSAVTRSY